MIKKLLKIFCTSFSIGCVWAISLTVSAFIAINALPYFYALFLAWGFSQLNSILFAVSICACIVATIVSFLSTLLISEDSKENNS